MPRWESLLDRWVEAGLIDNATADRIRVFEESRAQPQRLRWPILLALSLGGLLLAAGTLLFVAAHWDGLSPASRFALVLLLVAVFHVAAAIASERWRALAITFHAAGTVALGAGIFLAGQIFHLQEHWPGGVMLWAVGAWVAWGLLRDWNQACLAALLTPAWLAGEWIVRTESFRGSPQVLAQGLLLLAFVYLTALAPDRSSTVRRALTWIGGLALIPATVLVIVVAREVSGAALPTHLELLGWLCALGLPLLLAYLLRGLAAWINLIATLWVVVLGSLRVGVTLYLWCAAGSIGLIAWGLVESRRERINLGVAGFALTVLFFYFSSVMDKLDRAASLISLGVLFIGGGWILERARRRLVARLEART